MINVELVDQDGDYFFLVEVGTARFWATKREAMELSNKLILGFDDLALQKAMARPHNGEQE